ncbi:class I SAM-dependent methyltransferase [Gorillibacterium sp. sgz5001074]|uniref:class I SAM-dependent methyltransferase n=1 Tax=Gorillibacterium sp. sgz5001074 TaxID=3446695 RepID=UPI003F682137
MFVTTSYHPTPAEFELAERLSRRLSCRLVQRRQSSLPRLQRTYGAQDILVATTQGLRYFPEGAAQPFFFHPSSAQVRLKRILRGEPDALLETAEIQPGDRILDCTAGLGSESILFSYAAGGGGAVVSVESEPLVALILEDGLQSYISGLDVLDAAMRRIEVVQSDHLDFLLQQPDKSCDVVYFDPMFRQTIDDTNAIAPLKTIANHGALRPEAVEEARRVARRKVVMKEHRESGEFERLGFRMLLRPHTKIAYGVIEA